MACPLGSKGKQIHEEHVGPCQIYDAEEKDGNFLRFPSKRNRLVIGQYSYMAFTYCNKCQEFENPRDNQ